MKRLLSLIALGTLLIISTAQPAFAAVPFNPFGTACSQQGGTSTQHAALCSSSAGNGNPVTDTIINATHIVAILAGTAAIVIIIVSGLRFVSSQGDPEKAASARRSLIGAAIGLVVIVLAQAIITYVLGNVLN